MEEEKKRSLNVLFLGGAKRVSFGRKLIDAAARRGVQLKLFSYELTSEVPIASIGGIIIGRRWNAPDLLEHLHLVVRSYRIDVMLPFVDGAVGVVGEYIATYDDVWSPVVNPSKAEMLFDKSESAKAFEKAGIPIPKTFVGGRPELPLIAKPRHGSASNGIRILKTVSEFKSISKHLDEYLLQEYVADRTEYTVDCYITMRGKVLCVSPRVRLEVVGGEVSRTRTVDDEEIVALSQRVIKALELRGAVTLQFLRNNDSQRLMLMEINPRLGGGVVCSIHAGADIPGMIVDEGTGVATKMANNIKPGVLICRYFEEVAFNE